MMDDQMPQSDPRIEVQVAHGQRFLENIPKMAFWVYWIKKISVERQLTFRQALGNTQLELHIRIGSGRFMPDRRPADEIIIFE